MSSLLWEPAMTTTSRARVLQELRHDQAVGARAKHRHLVAELDLAAINAVDTAGHRFRQRRRVKREGVRNGEHLFLLDAHILGEAPVDVVAQRAEGGAVVGLLLAAVVAVAAVLGIVGGDAVAGLEGGDGLADFLDVARKLVAGRHRVYGEVGADAFLIVPLLDALADGGRHDADDHVVIAAGGVGDLAYAGVFSAGLIVDERFHGSHGKSSLNSIR